MIVVREQTTQMKPPTTECRRKRAGRAFAQLAEKKPDSTLECQFTKTGVSAQNPLQRSMSVMAILQQLRVVSVADEPKHRMTIKHCAVLRD
jgi:hypothetical protein